MKQTMKRVSVLFLFFALLLSLTFAVKTNDKVYAEADNLTLTVDTKTGMIGDTVDVALSMSHNPGVASIRVDVTYDTALTLTNVQFNTELGGTAICGQDYAKQPFALIWASMTDYTQDDVFATLTFEVSSTAVENQSYPISLTYDSENIYNAKEEAVNMTVVNGGISVISVIPGDINGDKKVNNKDVTGLMKYLAEYDIEVQEACLDVNGDGKVNNKDVTRLMQHLAGWTVEIYPKSSHVHQFAAEWSKDETYHWHAATCGHDTAKDKTTHDWDSGVVTKPATETEKGVMTYTCKVCQATKTELIIPDHIHNYNLKNTDDQYKDSDATCTSPATYYLSCSCGAHNDVIFESGKALGHEFEVSALFCKRCGSANINNFTESEDKTCCLQEYVENGKLYLLYYLGYENNVIMYDLMNEWVGKNSYTNITLKTTDLKDSVEKNEYTEGVATKVSATLEIYSSGSVSTGIKTSGSKASLEAGFKTNLKITSSSSYENSYSIYETARSSVESGVDFNNNFSLLGYYKLVVVGNFDVYLIIEYDPSSKSVSYMTDLLLIDGTASPGFVWANDDKAMPTKINDYHIDDYYSIEKIQDYIGQGTETNPYLIRDAETSEILRMNTNEYYRLENDLDLSGTAWTPISEFSGTLNGDDHEIKGLKIESNETTVGFVGILNSGAAIKNLIFTEATVTTNRTDKKDLNVGVIAGYVYGTIYKCGVNNSSVSGISKESKDSEAHNIYCNVGGIVGKAEGGTIEKCFISGSSVYGYCRRYDGDQDSGKSGNDAPHAYVGGVVGTAVSATITDCTADGMTLKAETYHRVYYWAAGGARHPYSYTYVAGIVGYISGDYTISSNTYSNNNLQTSVKIANDGGGGSDHDHSYVKKEDEYCS